MGDHFYLWPRFKVGEDIMGRLDVIVAALEAAQSTAADEAAQVQEHLAALGVQVADLQFALDELVAGEVTQEEIDAVVTQAEDIAAEIEAIDTEGDVVFPDEPPIEEPPVEEPPVAPPVV